MALTGFFYPRISYGSGPTLLDFTDPVNRIDLIISTLAGANIAEDGTREQLTQRVEYMVVLHFDLLIKSDLDGIWTWYSTWASLGKQQGLTLDRFATTTSQFEFTQYNSFFSKAELVNQPFGPLRRTILAKVRYGLDLAFRQGT